MSSTHTISPEDQIRSSHSAKSDVIVYGFPSSTYVNIVRFVLAHKNVPFEFCDIESKMNGPEHLALHPFNRVPILEHRGFRVYETAAITLYIDENFEGPSLQPLDPHDRARMLQWMSALNSYFYPYAIYHLAHERLVFPALGIAPDEKVVTAALPNIDVALDVMERALEHDRGFIVTGKPTLADFFLLPTVTGLTLIAEGQKLLENRPRIKAWWTQMGQLPAVAQIRAEVAPHLGKPVEHARRWVDSHRPYYGGEYKPYYGG